MNENIVNALVLMWEANTKLIEAGKQFVLAQNLLVDELQDELDLPGMIEYKKRIEKLIEQSNSDISQVQIGLTLD